MSTIGDVSTIPAGWYPDPQDGSRSRWWDGSRWTASVSDPQPPAPAPTTFVEPQQTAPQQYVQQPFTPAVPVAAGSGLALTRRQLRAQSEQLALGASSAQPADTGVIARSAHAAEPMPQVPAPAELVATPVVEAPVEPTPVDTTAADAAAAALVAAAIASPEPVAAPAESVPFDWSPNAVMPARVEAPAPVAEFVAPVAAVVPEPVAAPVAPVAAPVVTPAVSTAVATVGDTVPAEPLSNYAALAALFGSVDHQSPEPQWENDKSKTAVAQFDYAASFAQEDSPFGFAAPAQIEPPTEKRSTLSANTGAIWIFVIMPVLQIGMAWLAFDYLGLAAGGLTLLGFLAVEVLLYVVLAGIDGKSLKSLGHPKVPSMLWAIVPLLYLIMRVVRTGRRSVGPLLIWLLTQVAIVALALLLAMPIILALMGSSPMAVDAPVVPDAPTMTQVEYNALLTPEGATAHVASYLADEPVPHTDVSCAAFTVLEPASMTLCSFTVDDTILEGEFPIGNVTVVP
ncbi:DUF2510 domain-containing protein [Glaciihabitans arcticus]|uniref:DUF2510 domain-containing protein n=1 Tax=Glaciihabitans arcticus TaxID=2668039 RepID=UPI001386E701|nr:DUF2510 domain-containing protein [Glaciihabitans arcticus]